ncbi:alpha-amylase family glycosyl hydrolase [Citromicrobium bathyomarinum]|uniref:alpha-amylase family glycosyl hydrolase n=1 Tax=Citromicrobium bathyomarinum TaxID=72174 RepID=UPI001E2871E6|nr:alpha-amylase family glycosyl hydrolase [Citromicrobium bathyomarinum]MCD1623341.1 alpha-amylase [Citromicrobium bathyomarinum]
MKRAVTLLAAASLLGVATSALAQEPAAATGERLSQDEVIYFVLPDRFANGDTANDTGGYPADRLQSGYDPTHRGFYHGGDLKGLTEKLDYIQGLGVTAIWFAPIFKNKPVQGPAGDESAGYHGYWVTDFTSVDPHLGTNAEFKAFVDAAHARGMKVYMDIITNHTADVIQYAGGDYAYRSKADYPYSTLGGPEGERINPGFAGDDDPSPENWAKLTDPRFAYTPVVPEAERDIKVPAWLNDPIYYHNRGNSEWWGESAVYGDFAGLDDLATEHPRVLAGMIDIFGSWIDRFGIDGFRIDTVKHVNPEFWQAFVPAMQARAEAKGIADFLIFGEVYVDGARPGPLAAYTHRDALPAVLDFTFQSAVRDVVADNASPEVLVQMLEGDVLYAGGEEAALRLPTFLGNHDMGRFSMFVKAGNPDAGQSDLLARTMLGHAMLLTLRGIPTVYYGDEQGFISDGNDQQAREDMFASQVADYNDNDLLGTQATTADANYAADHPLYRMIARLSALRKATPALSRGLTEIGTFDREPGLLSLIRRDPENGQTVLLVFNTSGQAITRNVEIDMKETTLKTLDGTCPAQPTAPGSARFTLPPFGWAVCELGRN